MLIHSLNVFTLLVCLDAVASFTSTSLSYMLALLMMMMVRNTRCERIQRALHHQCVFRRTALAPCKLEMHFLGQCVSVWILFSFRSYRSAHPSFSRVCGACVSVNGCAAVMLNPSVAGPFDDAQPRSQKNVRRILPLCCAHTVHGVRLFSSRRRCGGESCVDTVVKITTHAFRQFHLLRGASEKLWPGF